MQSAEVVLELRFSFRSTFPSAVNHAVKHGQYMFQLQKFPRPI